MKRPRRRKQRLNITERQHLTAIVKTNIVSFFAGMLSGIILSVIITIIGLL